MNKAIVTVLANDRVGIIATVSSRLSQLSVNILDMTQTIWDDNVFVMLMLVDTTTTQRTFHEIREDLAALGEEQHISIRIQREEIFNAMHTV